MGEERAREGGLDEAHSRRIVGISVRQRAQQMDMVRQNDLGIE
jgi:hypothetical protein